MASSATALPRHHPSHPQARRLKHQGNPKIPSFKKCRSTAKSWAFLRYVVCVWLCFSEGLHHGATATRPPDHEGAATGRYAHANASSSSVLQTVSPQGILGHLGLAIAGFFGAGGPSLRNPEEVKPLDAEPPKDKLSEWNEREKAISANTDQYAVQGKASDASHESSTRARSKMITDARDSFKQPVDENGHKADNPALNDAFKGPEGGVEIGEDETEKSKLRHSLKPSYHELFPPLDTKRGTDNKYGQYNDREFNEETEKSKGMFGDLFGKITPPWFNPTISRELPIREAIHNIKLASRYARWITQAHLNALYNQDNVTDLLQIKFEALKHGVDKFTKDVWQEMDVEDALRMNQLKSERPHGEWDPKAGFTRDGEGPRGYNSAEGGYDPTAAKPEDMSSTKLGAREVRSAAQAAPESESHDEQMQETWGGHEADPHASEPDHEADAHAHAAQQFSEPEP